MTQTERIKILALQGTANVDIAAQLGISRQRVSYALHERPAMFKRGRKPLPPVCRMCGVGLTTENKAKNSRACKSCMNKYAKELKQREVTP